MKQIVNYLAAALLKLKVKYLNLFFKSNKKYSIGYILSLLPKDQIVRKASKSKKRKGKWIIFNCKKVRCYSRKYFFYMQQYFAKKQIICPQCKMQAEYFKLMPSGNVSLRRTDYTFNLFAMKNGKQVMFDIDHIRPVSRGGKNNKENLRILCHQCNNIKANKIKD